GRCPSAEKVSQTFRCSRTVLVCGGKVSPTRKPSVAGASMSATRKSGAKSPSDIAVAAPAGPAPAISTSKSVNSARLHGVPGRDHAGRIDRRRATALRRGAGMRNGAHDRADHRGHLLHAVGPGRHQPALIVVNPLLAVDDALAL